MNEYRKCRSMRSLFLIKTASAANLFVLVVQCSTLFIHVLMNGLQIILNL